MNTKTLAYLVSFLGLFLFAAVVPKSGPQDLLVASVSFIALLIVWAWTIRITGS